jgi:hypothetical protein
MASIFDRVQIEVRRMSDDSFVKTVDGITNASRMLGYKHSNEATGVRSKIVRNKNKKWKHGCLYNGELVYCVVLSGELYERYKNS